jgi:uncharacterized protein (UPF0548 family)
MRLSADRYAGAEPDYPCIGGTRTGSAPAGYRRLRRRYLIGTGMAAMTGAADAIFRWRMHRAVGMRIAASAARAAPGVTVVGAIGVGALRIVTPCRIVWAAEPGAGAGATGFAYGTLPGHPMRGEESFLLDQDGDGQVWLTIESFSLPARWFTRAAGPAAPVLQALFARRCAAVLRRLA